MGRPPPVQIFVLYREVLAGRRLPTGASPNDRPVEMGASTTLASKASTSNIVASFGSVKRFGSLIVSA